MNNGNATQLEKLASASESREEWGAWAIIAGLVFEIGIALAVTFGFDNKPVEHWSAVAATVLIAGGVYCEIHFGRKASEAHKALRAISDERVADANENAARAHERAAILEKEAADANARTAEIERLTAWRRLSPEQRDIISRAIRFKMPPTVKIECVFDAEAIRFADELKELFIEAARTAVERLAIPMPSNGVLEYGLSVSSEPELHARIVEEAFRNAGISISRYATAYGGQSRVNLYVGYKPEYRQQI